MSLRRKLLTAFGGLVFFTLFLAGMTLRAVNQWNANETRLAEHYQRSILLESIRASTFRAFKEVPDAVTGDDPDSREEFDLYLQPARQKFEAWRELAKTREEQKQVAEVRAALATLVKDANEIFTLVERGDKKNAFILMEGRLEDQNFRRFNEVSAQAVASDEKARVAIRAQNERAQNIERLTLFVTALATLILSLLLGAYLGSDLFSPLQNVEQAMRDAAAGNNQIRLDAEREDEIGRINAAFNALLEAQSRREKLLSLGKNNGNGHREWGQETIKVALHSQISNLRANTRANCSKTAPNAPRASSASATM